MKTDIELQIENWEEKKSKYERKDVTLRHRIATMENDRSRMDTVYAFKPELGKFYKRLDSLYKQLYTLSAKINKCNSYLSTLRMCQSWS